VSFEVPAAAYDRFVGRYSYALCEALASAAGITEQSSVLDVGAGTGIGTQYLVDLAGSERVAAVEPSEPFAAALRERLPAVDVRGASAESLPFEDDHFDAALAQLVLNFVPDPEAGAAEMRRVTRPRGVAAACVWDSPGKMTLLRTYWDAAAAVDSERARDEDEGARMRFVREGELGELWRETGLEDVEEGEIVVSASYEDFDDLWQPFTAGVGPAGRYAVSLDDEVREALRVEYRRRLSDSDGSFRLEARAWFVVGKA
jgi:SAM-dependent methyltransferase